MHILLVLYCHSPYYLYHAYQVLYCVQVFWRERGVREKKRLQKELYRTDREKEKLYQVGVEGFLEIM